MRILKPIVILTSIGLASCALGPDELGLEETPEVGSTARLLRVPRPVPDQYIVVLADTPSAAADDVERSADELSTRYDASVLHVYQHTLRGFSAHMTEDSMLALLADPRVAYIEEDAVVEAMSTPWNLDRVDQRDLPLDGLFSTPGTGAGAHAYVIDSGIRITHTEFGGRASADFTAISDGNGAIDCNGHGTGVASVLGGATLGLARSVQLHSVRVLSCSGSGTTAGVIAGVDWVTANHIKPAVATMSLGGSGNTSLDTAVRSSIAAGVTYAVAMGSSNSGACSSSPARVTEAISVGASTSTDSVASFSDHGPCLDLYAPGSSILTATHTSDTATLTRSGNSFATPLVAAAAALYLQTDPAASPATVQSLITSNATQNRLSNVPANTANRLLYTRFIGAQLASGVSAADAGHGQGDMRYYPFLVPTGTSRVDVRISGGSGDADLYVRGVTPPTLSSYTCRPYLSGNEERCTITGPSAGTWYAMLHGWSAYAGVSVTAWISRALVNGVAQSGVSGSHGSQQFWTVDVPAGAGTLTISISGGSGDADLYVRRGDFPTLSSYDCRPYLGGNNEACTFPSPTAGTYFVMLRGYSAFSGVTLTAQY